MKTFEISLGNGNEKITDAQLHELLALEERASAYPWTTYGSSNQNIRTDYRASEFRVYKLSHPDDAAFICEARNSIRPIILELLKARELVKALRFYANQENLIQGFEEAECPSDERGLLCTPGDQPDGVTVEDGFTARNALKAYDEVWK